jgi:hypothetical protein
MNDAGNSGRKNIEIIIPLRNPSAVFERTISSLTAQTDCRFSVLFSDNHSTQGLALVTEAIAELEVAGIPVRRICPPYELGRVEHWNWSHHETKSEWLKPLFVGDWLEPSYVAELRAALIGYPNCKYVYSAYVLHRDDQAPVTMQNPWLGRFLNAEKMRRIVLCEGGKFGPPSVAAYERTVFVALGGFPTSLPICSDNLLFCTMASRFGAFGIADPLCHFNIHGARFSTTLGTKKAQTLREVLTYHCLLAYSAWSSRAIFSLPGFLMLLFREMRAYMAK